MTNNFSEFFGKLMESVVSALGKLLKWKDIPSLDSITEIPIKPPVSEAKSPVTKKDTTPPAKPPETPIKRDIRWRGGALADRLAMYEMINRVCKELAPELTRDIQATIAGESGWNQWCENHNNKNGTADYGIAQFNDGKIKGVPMWIGNGATFRDKDEVLNNPKKCIRVMVQTFKEEHAKWWMAYPHRATYFDTKPV